VQYPVIVAATKDAAATTKPHPRVTYGIDREIPRVDTAPPALASKTQPPFADPGAPPLHYLTSTGDKPSPKTGIWRVSVAPDHPLAQVLNHTWSAPNQGQVHVQKGQTFPHPQQDWMMQGVTPAQMTWWLLEAD
jgi:hypothetical protein